MNRDGMEPWLPRQLVNSLDIRPKAWTSKWLLLNINDYFTPYNYSYLIKIFEIMQVYANYLYLIGILHKKEHIRKPLKKQQYKNLETNM